MDIRIYPGRLSGTLSAISSKSDVHRALICAALSQNPCSIRCNVYSRDIEATVRCLNAVGAGIHYSEEEELLRVVPISGTKEGTAGIFCGESGSTLRFLLPVMSALKLCCDFSGAGKLPERPISLLTSLLREHGAVITEDQLPLTTEGGLKNGSFLLPGNISSQYITGLLLAFPLLGGPSELQLTTELQSAAYVDMTLDTMQRFGVRIRREGNRFFYDGSTGYHAPELYEAEGDWSNAAFWLCGDRMGENQIRVSGLRSDSLQGDRAVKEILSGLFSGPPRDGERVIDASGIPDLVPILSALAAISPGVTRFIRAERLRLKESDRLAAVSGLLSALGADVAELPDGLLIHGKERLPGGVSVDGCNDHRIVMTAALLASACDAPVVITGAEAVSKSYPAFFADLNQLGGKTDVI